MKLNSNFERARALASKWPEWKRSYELTKDSVRCSALTPDSLVSGEGVHEISGEKKAANLHEAK